MSLFLRKIFSSSFKKSGPIHLFKNERKKSSCSTRRTNLTSQSYEAKVLPRHDPLAGSPVSDESLGQPTYWTHPHRLMEGEVVPGISKKEFQDRREKLVENIRSYASKNDFIQKTHFIVVPSSSKKYMTEAIPYVFRQNTDFLYLTGCLEPDSVLLIIIYDNEKQESILFLRGKDPHSELWDGPRTGIDQALDFFGVDNSFPLSSFEPVVSSLIKEHSDCNIWYDYGSAVQANVHKFMKEFLPQHASKVWDSPKPFIQRQRLYKSPAEQELMKKSCEIGSNAFKATIKNSKPWDNEAQIFARVDYECRMNGAEYLAYPPVVAGGNRANIIHYINNDQIVGDNELVLMDAGCEYHGYTSDITRTWPISGKFSSVQRILYEVVYSLQTELIQACSTFPSLDQLFIMMCKSLGVKLKDAGVLSSKLVDSNLSRVAYAFCPHHVSHYLGMDVHDTSSVPRNIALKPGMVFTIEPGVYINLSNKLANPEFRGYGIRIEDDILMTENGPMVLTSCPKYIDDIENLMKES